MISPEELQELESSLLPSLERHHLRLLAHGLRTLQCAAGRRSGALPTPGDLSAWAAQQPALTADPAFAESFLKQLALLAEQLAAIAAERQRTPLGLELSDLAAWAHGQAEQRLSPEPPPD